MKFHLAFYPTVLLAAALPLTAQTELLTNGDFETGDFTGWTVTDVNGFIEINDGTFVPGGTGVAQAPLGGTYDAVTNGPGPGMHEIAQQFLVPAGLALAQLSWDDQINNLAGSFSDPNHEFRVLIEDTSGVLIAEVFSTNPGDPLIQQATSRSFDITAILAPLAGQTVQLSIEEEDSLFFFNLYLDNISLMATTGVDFASWSIYGDGCGQGPGSSFHESFNATTNPFDMAGTGFSMFLVGSEYTVLPPLGSLVPPTSPDLGLGDDVVVNIPLPSSGPWAGGFVHKTGVTTSIDIDSNGSVYFQPGAATDWSPTVGEFLGGLPRIAPMFSDLSPNNGGTVHAAQDTANPALFHITWVNVPTFAGTEIGDMQVTLDVTASSIEVNYGAFHTANGIAGYSPGGGVPNPGARDLSVDAVVSFMTGNDFPAIKLNAVAGDRPVIGQVFDMEVSDLPATSLGGALFLFLGQQLPGIDLGFINAPGCEFLVAGPFLGEIPIGGTNPTAGISINLTNAGPSLAGLQVFVQAAMIGIDNVPLMVGMTNGGAMLIDVN